MPDLMTHALVSYLPARLALDRADDRGMFVLGAILPDLVARAPKVLWPQSSLVDLLAPVGHTPFGAGLICLALTFFFPEAHRPRYLGRLLAGAGVHLLLDLLQKSVTNGSYFWFFPFSWESFQLGLFWPDQTVWAIPPLIMAAATVELWALRQERGGS